MELESLRQSIRTVLKPSRYEHSIGVEEVACDLAIIYGIDEKAARMTAILHDCAKNFSDEELVGYCNEHHIEISKSESISPYLLHAKVGAVIAKNQYNIVDEEIINAILYHTTGRPNMTMLEKIIFVADYIEPTRKMLPRMEEIRELTYQGAINKAIVLSCKNTINYLNSTNQYIDPLTIETYQFYQNELGNGDENYESV